MMIKTLNDLFIRLIKPNAILIAAVIMLLSTALITMQNILLGLNSPGDAGTAEYYQNYLLFKKAFQHLIQHTDLYSRLQGELYLDYYKYSPAFALFMAPLAVLPDPAGLFIWNLINVFVLFYAIGKIPDFDKLKVFLVYTIIFVELITSVQNSQSNALNAGLVILGFVFMEKKKPGAASFFIVASMFIKVFGGVALALFLLYPEKRKALMYTIIWILFFAFIPLVVVPFGYLISLYKDWFNLMITDQEVSYGLSVAGVFYKWFGINVRIITLVLAAVVFLIPFFRMRIFQDYSKRLLLLASMLIWMVIFNLKAESPTYIIAMSGVAIWFVICDKTKTDVFLLISAIIFTVLSPTDLFPPAFRRDFFVPYAIKAVPCILIWMKTYYSLVKSE